MVEARPSLRLDKWLWYARFFKTRTLAAKQVTGGQVRVNSNRVTKASASVSVGDVLTFAQGRQIRVIEVAALGERRGPAPEAQTLYTDLSPPPERGAKEEAAQRAEPKAGEPPSKRERRAAAKLKSFDLE